MNAKRPLTTNERGCFIFILTIAAVLAGLGWLLAEFLLAPVHCGGAVCEMWIRDLKFSLAGTLAGMGCLWLAVANMRPRRLLSLGAGVLGFTALGSFGNPGAALLTGVDFLLAMGVVGWLLVLGDEG